MSVVLVLAMAFVSPEKSVFSRGELDADHSDLACDACHDAFSSFANDDKCVECHEEQELTPAAKFSASRCVGCHKEHVGAGADQTAVGDSTCQRCHDPGTVHERAPVVLAEKLDSPPTNCLECHGNHEEHKLNLEPAIADVRRHLVAAHVRGSPLFHKDTCAKCHQDQGLANGASAASIPGFFDPHVTHVAQLNIGCTWCHDSVDITQHSGAAFRRNANTERCVQCHEGEYYAEEDDE
jgi:hypothetical protein